MNSYKRKLKAEFSFFKVARLGIVNYNTFILYFRNNN